ncbi:MAG: hypothetical protein WBE76_15545, partial [Terracidiphilus sp.]
MKRRISMKIGPITSAAVIALFLSGSRAGPAQTTLGESFFAAMPDTVLAEGQAATGAADGMVFAEGTRAINDGRWPDAITIFASIAEKKTDHAEGALYWKAYAENKLGKSGDALATCSALRADFPKSSWLDDCGALEIEIHAKNGKPVLPITQQSDDLRLLALNSMMQHDPAHAQAQIQEILDDEDSSEKLRDGALFILGKHQSKLTFPQIVRLSYVEGDVRIARGRENEKSTGATWEKAVADLPLEAGFNLVTGAGRAEIELEDASTVYLGENSVLALNDLHTTDGVPYTEMALLSGTVTLHVKPYVPDEIFILRTPSDDDLVARYPGASYIRVTSYVDATAITPEEGGGILRPSGLPDQAAQGQTLFYRGNRSIDAPDGYIAVHYAAWDEWVANRVARRSAAMNAMMKEAGLTSPLPGLAEMDGQGKFFDCAPYGTCWEPAAAVQFDEQSQDESADPQGSIKPASLTSNNSSARLVRASFDPIGAQAAQASSSRPLDLLDREEFFPCAPAAIRYTAVRDPVTGRQTIVDTGWDAGAFPYRWGVCHAGYWIHRKRHYVWVVGKRHHHEPVRWVKSGRTVAYVPIHPRDVNGKLPINSREDVFAVSRKNGISVQRVQLGAEHPVEPLDSPPREFRTVYLPPLARAEEPRIEAHAIKDASGNKSAIARAGVPITFDRKSQTFTMPVHVMQGNKMVTIAAPISNRGGNLQAGGKAGSFGAGGSHG